MWHRLLSVATVPLMTLRLTRAIEIVSWVTQIASYLGLPIAVLGGFIAGLFAWTKEIGPLLAILIVFFVVTSVLQSLAAAVFLIDRVLDRRRQIEDENRAIAYQLAPVDAALVRDDANECRIPAPCAAFEFKWLSTALSSDLHKGRNRRPGNPKREAKLRPWHSPSQRRNASSV